MFQTRTVQDLSCTYLAHHELESVVIVILLLLFIIIYYYYYYYHHCYYYYCCCCTSGVQTSTANLERVRKMKTRHQRLQTRVTTVREELQSFLEDDDDMMKMCLTHKMEQGQNQELVRAQG